MKICIEIRFDFEVSKLTKDLKETKDLLAESEKKRNEVEELLEEERKERDSNKQREDREREEADAARRLATGEGSIASRV